jgi:hypothetical protein
MYEICGSDTVYVTMTISTLCVFTAVPYTVKISGSTQGCYLQANQRFKATG